MNRIIFNSPCGRIIDYEIVTDTVPLVGDKVDFPRACFFEVKSRTLDLHSMTWKLEVAR